MRWGFSWPQQHPERHMSVTGFDSKRPAARVKRTGYGWFRYGQEKCIFIQYIDIFAARPVGDVVVPPLRIVHILDRTITSAFRIYNKPYYIPLSRFSFDMVEILLNNYHCKIIQFAAAISVVTLHFHNPKHCDLEFVCVFNCLNAWPYNEVPKYMKTIFVCKPVMACPSFRVAAINADRQFLSRVGSEGPPLVKDWG